MPQNPAVKTWASIGLALVTAGTAHAIPVTSAPASASVTHSTSARQQQYAKAAAEFGVPVEVLLGVSYLESQWNTNAGTPSVAAGYGPMHLTDFTTATTSGGTEFDEGGDPRGDDSRKALHPTAPPTGVPTASLQTVRQAAKLTGAAPSALRGDPSQNIRGGAALLASYQHQLNLGTSDPGDWYAAVAKYSGATDTGSASDFANEVFDVIHKGETRTTDDGQVVTLGANPGVQPNTPPIRRIGLANPRTTGAACPAVLTCALDLAAYAPYGPNPGDYGNYDTSNRPATQKIDYIVIHDTEATWDTTLGLIQDPKYVSWNYTIRSSDGAVDQHVLAKNVAWHAGNWYVNAKSIGVEHEGFLARSGWYTEAMYESSAKLVRYLADKYRIPLDRQHILGHDDVPGVTGPQIPSQHTDPGPYWGWAHYMSLLGAPGFAANAPFKGMVYIRPDMATNNVPFTGCTSAGTPCPARGSSEVILHNAPSDSAPPLNDIGLHSDGSPQTMDVNDVGSRMATGQEYAVADRQPGWIAVWYLGQKGWFHASDAVWAAGYVVTPKPGESTVPVYGRAYPEASAYPAGTDPQPIVPQPYTFSAGQRYVFGGIAPSEYLPTVYDPTGTLNVPVVGKTRYYEIQFGHRVEYVNADDVHLVPSFR
jgi:N-acetylmuramoyl-L-alanine amidase